MNALRRSARPSSEGILASAEKVFAEQGYGETSLRQLIAAAGVSTTAFYSRFDSKEEVLRALVLDLLGQLHSDASMALAKATGLDEGFRRGVEVLVAVLSPRRELCRIALTEAAASGAVVETLGQLHHALAALLAGELARLDRRGAIAKVDAGALAWALVGALHMQIVRWAVYGQLTTKQLGPALDAVAATLLPALAPTSAPKPRKPRTHATRRGR